MYCVVTLDCTLGTLCILLVSSLIFLSRYCNNYIKTHFIQHFAKCASPFSRKEKKKRAILILPSAVLHWLSCSGASIWASRSIEYYCFASSTTTGLFATKTFSWKRSAYSWAKKMELIRAAELREMGDVREFMGASEPAVVVFCEAVAIWKCLMLNCFRLFALHTRLDFETCFL